MPYQPQGTVLKDSWFYRVGDSVHALFMQRDDVERPEDLRQFCTLGQASTRDLMRWSPLPVALRGGPRGSYDDLRMATGSAPEVDGTFYNYFSVKGTAQGGWFRIALATSTDGVGWSRSATNPILTPDSRFYYGEENPIPIHCHAWPTVDCRDFAVVADPDGDGFWGFFAARRFGTECAWTSVIALAHSDDLLQWEQHPPCFMPDRYACVEVPDVFYLDGRWYMLFLVGNHYGERSVMAESNLVHGTCYAVADRPQGPYHEPENNVLIGSTARNGFTCRTVDFAGDKVLLYTHEGAISLPARLSTTDGGRLVPYYHHAIDACRGDAVVESTGQPHLPNDGRWGSIGTWTSSGTAMAGSCRTDWAILVYEPQASDAVCSADIRLTGARSAGLVMRIQGEEFRGFGTQGYAVMLDSQSPAVSLCRLRDFREIDRRRFEPITDRAYALKCVLCGTIMNVYVDDVLVLQSHDDELAAGRFGLFVERGSAEFSNLRVQTLLGAS